MYQQLAGKELGAICEETSSIYFQLRLRFSTKQETHFCHEKKNPGSRMKSPDAWAAKRKQPIVLITEVVIEGSLFYLILLLSNGKKLEGFESCFS